MASGKIKLSLKPFVFTVLFGQVLLPVQVAHHNTDMILMLEMSVVFLGFVVSIIDGLVKNLRGSDISTREDVQD